MIAQRLIPIVVFIGVLLASCGARANAPPAAADTSVQVAGGTYTRIAAAQLSQMLQQKGFFFVNTHIPYEGEIAQTDAFIPYDQTAQQLSQYPADKNARIVVYCRSGRMSAIAAEALVKAGYTDVWDLEGGMIVWEQAGYALIKK